MNQESDDNPSLLREFADFRYATQHYGIIGDFSLKDVCLSSAQEITDLRQQVHQLSLRNASGEVEIQTLQQELAAARAELAAVTETSDLAASFLRKRDELATARKYIGTLTEQLQQCQHYGDELAAARALLREAVDDPTCAFGDPWRSNARAAGGEK